MPLVLKPPAQDLANAASLFGFSYGGDIGDWTVYRTRRGKPVFFPQAPPKEPPSPLQVAQRTRFKSALLNYTVSPQKQQWERAAKLLTVCANGLNLYITSSLDPDRNYITQTLLRIYQKTGISLTVPTYIP